MGYVNDTNFAQFISPFDFGLSAGTWTPAISSSVVSNDRTAADASVTVLIPIRVPSNASALKGSKLASVKVWYSIGTAAADDFATAEIVKLTLTADDTAITAAAVDATLDTGHDTAAERLAVDSDHCMTLTLDTPAWVDDNDAYYVHLVIDNAAGTVLKFFGAQAYFTLRA